MKAADATRVLAIVAADSGVSIARIKGSGRVPTVVHARRCAWALMRRLGASYPEIGTVTGHDHTSVMAGVRAAERDHRDRLTLLARLVLVQRDHEPVTCPTCGHVVEKEARP